MGKTQTLKWFRQKVTWTQPYWWIWWINGVSMNKLPVVALFFYYAFVFSD
jgi:hypothetical protein